MAVVRDWDGDDEQQQGEVVEEPEAHARRLAGRDLLREFLRAVPREQVGAKVTIVRPDGTARIYTRGELSAAIDGMRPRKAQILRLGVEERWPRGKVCEYLKGIALKTYEREQVEGIDDLLAL